MPAPGEITEERCVRKLAAMLNENPFTEEDEEEFRRPGISIPAKHDG
jgi:hypothetical protein